MGCDIQSYRFHQFSSTGIAVDPSGNVYVTGVDSRYSTDVDFRTIKYSSSGNIVWNVTYSPAGFFIGGSVIAVDSSQNVYITTGGSGTIKYNSSGNIFWDATYSGYAYQMGIALDPSGNVYVAGDGSHIDWSGQSVGNILTIKYQQPILSVTVTCPTPITTVQTSQCTAVVGDSPNRSSPGPQLTGRSLPEDCSPRLPQARE